MDNNKSKSHIKKVTNHTQQITQKLHDIITLSEPSPSQEVQASEMLQIENHASSIIRMVEELLSLSRTLKEHWVLNQLPVKCEEGKDEVAELKSGIDPLIDQALSVIIQSKGFEEEVDSDGFESDLEPEIKAEEIKKEEESKEDVDMKNVEIKEETTQEIKTEPQTEEDQTQQQQQQQQQQQHHQQTHDLDPIQPLNDNEEDLNTKDQYQSSDLNDFNNPIDLDDDDGNNLDDLDFESFGNIGGNDGRDDNDDDDDDDVIMLD